MIKMMMRHQHVLDRHVVFLGLREYSGHVPGRVHDSRFLRARVADEIDEILHGAQLHLLEINRLLAHAAALAEK